MSTSLDVLNVVHRDDLLQFVVSVKNISRCGFDLCSRQFIIRKAAAFTLRLMHIGTSETCFRDIIFFNFQKLRPSDNLNHTMNISSIALGIKGKEFTTGDRTWRVLHDKNNAGLQSFDVTITSLVTAPKVDIAPKMCFLKLHEIHDDTEFTDFELRGEDGSVHVHKAVLAASSPVLRQMLSGTWRETKEGHVDLPGISQLDLQHLKGYLYLHQLPDSGLEQLLLLSSYYIMPDLEQTCVDKMVNTLTAENACDLLNFAAKHKMNSLTVAVLESIQSGAIKVSDIKEQLLRGTSVE